MGWRRAPKPNDYEFTNTMGRIINDPTFQGKDVASKAFFLDYVIKSLKADIIGSSLTAIYFGSDDTDDFDDVSDPSKGIQYADFPLNILSDARGSEEVSFAGNSVLSLPWEPSRLVEAAVDVAADGLRIEKGNYNGVYYPEISLIRMVDGRHHSAAALPPESGVVIADVFSLVDAFPTVSTDGVFWYKNGHPLFCARDVRFSLIYELARKQYEMVSEFIVGCKEKGMGLDAAAREFFWLYIKSINAWDDSAYGELDAEIPKHPKFMERSLNILQRYWDAL